MIWIHSISINIIFCPHNFYKQVFRERLPFNLYPGYGCFILSLQTTHVFFISPSTIPRLSSIQPIAFYSSLGNCCFLFLLDLCCFLISLQTSAVFLFLFRKWLFVILSQTAAVFSSLQASAIYFSPQIMVDFYLYQISAVFYFAPENSLFPYNSDRRFLFFHPYKHGFYFLRKELFYLFQLKYCQEYFEIIS